MLREKNGWTQEHLAQRAGSKQETISLWENPNYGSYNIKTLKTLAAAFDVALLVKFVPFSKLVEWNVNLTPDRLAPASFEQDQAMQPNSAPLTLQPVLATASVGTLTWATGGTIIAANLQYPWQNARDYLQSYAVSLSPAQASEVAASDKSKVAGLEHTFALAA
jgi:transcriptional regulator with XRE-family HTH domain